MITSLLTWITTNATTLGVVIGVGPTMWAIVQFILNRRAEAKRQEFETYHSLVKQLVEPEDPGQPMRLDRQIAILFELRNFRRYFPVTLRILRGLREDWAVPGPTNKRRLQEEIDLSIQFIERKV